MARNEIDRVFELCLLLVTVIGAAELQYATFMFAQPTDASNTLMVNRLTENISTTREIGKGYKT
jgi:hypothetical protein